MRDDLLPHTWTPARPITLTAVPDEGAFFTGWSAPVPAPRDLHFTWAATATPAPAS